MRSKDVLVNVTQPRLRKGREPHAGRELIPDFRDSWKLQCTALSDDNTSWDEP